MEIFMTLLNYTFLERYKLTLLFILFSVITLCFRNNSWDMDPLAFFIYLVCGFVVLDLIDICSDITIHKNLILSNKFCIDKQQMPKLLQLLDHHNFVKAKTKNNIDIFLQEHTILHMDKSVSTIKITTNKKGFRAFLNIFFKQHPYSFINRIFYQIFNKYNFVLFLNLSFILLFIFLTYATESIDESYITPMMQLTIPAVLTLITCAFILFYNQLYGRSKSVTEQCKLSKNQLEKFQHFITNNEFECITKTDNFITFINDQNTIIQLNIVNHKFTVITQYDNFKKIINLCKNNSINLKFYWQ